MIVQNKKTATNFSLKTANSEFSFFKYFSNNSGSKNAYVLMK
jgi:hypothetical protein